MLPEAIFYCLLAGSFIISILYASVGHGGASGYLAVVSLLGLASPNWKMPVLLLNVCVASIAFIIYGKKNTLNRELIFPLIATSIPAVIIGTNIDISTNVFKYLLGLCLLAAALWLVVTAFYTNEKETHQPKQYGLIIIGTGIGLISGMIGVGGGILLSPILLLLRWCSSKQVAYHSAFFIIINSLVGVATIFISKQSFVQPISVFQLIFLGIILVVGAFLGSCMGRNYFNKQAIKIILAIVLILASVKLYV